MRLMPTKLMLKPLVVGLLEDAQRTLAEMVPLMGALLQYTNAFNFSILCKIRQLRTQSRTLIQQMLDTCDIETAEALVQCMVA